MASTTKQVDRAGVMFWFGRNHVVCNHWSITVRAFIHQTCMARSWHKTDKSDIVQPYTSLHICSKCLRASLPCPWMANPPSMAVQVTTSCGRLSLHLQCSHILHTCHASYSPKTTTDSKALWMIWSWARLPSSNCNHSGTCIQHPQKSNRVGLHIFLLHCLNSSRAFCPSPHFTCPNTMAFQVTMF